jgi:hypothetical protein
VKAQVKNLNGTPTVFLNDEPIFFNHQWLSNHPGPNGFPAADAVRGFGKAGVHLYAMGVAAAADYCGHWCGPREGLLGHHDFSMVEPMLRAIIECDPDAHFHLRMYFETQEWWNRLYPDECEIASNGQRLNHSYASKVWLQQVKDFIHEYVEHLRKIGLYERVVAYQVQAGVCGEWIKNVTSMGYLCNDFSAPMRQHFRSWLRERYDGDAAALQNAWADAGITFDTAEVPPGDEQHRTSNLHFRDPAREQRVIDYYHCLAELVADDTIELCRAVKDATRGEALAGAFFGYLMDLSWNDSFFGAVGYPSEYSTTQRSGHLGLRKVIRAPEVDYIVSPYGYAFRGIGGDGLPMPPVDSLRIHDKLYILEEDSHLHNEQDPDGKNFDRKHSIAINQREFGETITHGLGIWWFADAPPGAYSTQHANFQPWLEKFQRIGTWAVRHLDNRPRSEIAVLLDDESFLYETLRNDFDLPGIFHQRVQGLSRFGAPHDVFLLEDLLEGRLPDYKLYIFLNAFALDAKRRAALAQRIRRPGATAVWIYAPGYIKPPDSSQDPQARASLLPLSRGGEGRGEGGGAATGQMLSMDHMTELTGFRFGRGDNPWGPFVHITNFDHPITRDLPQDLFWGTDNRLGPLFHVARNENPDATVLGEVVYSLGRCQPGFAVKSIPLGGGAWNSIYIAAPNLPAPVLRSIARFAGAHVYSDAGDVLHATPQILSVHTLAGGPRIFALPQRAQVVYDLYNDVELAHNADSFPVTLPPVSSALYFTGDAETLRAYRS